MKKRIKRLRFCPQAFWATWVVLVLTPSVCTAADVKKEYRMHLAQPAHFYQGIAAKLFCDLVNHKTDKRIKVIPLYDGQQVSGEPFAAAQLVMDGAIDCALESVITISPLIPECGIFLLPFLVPDYERLDRLQEGKTGQEVFDAMKRRGLKPLAWGENGFRQITNNKRIIAAPNDLRGLKIRVVDNETLHGVFNHLEAEPLRMKWKDTEEAFKFGVINGQESALSTFCIPRALFQHNRYVTLWNYVPNPSILYWNKKQFDAFPKVIQSAIAECAIQACEFEKALCRAGLDKGQSLTDLKTRFKYEIVIPSPVDYLKAKGMVVTTLTEENRRLFVEATRPARDKAIANIGRELYEKAIADMCQRK